MRRAVITTLAFLAMIIPSTAGAQVAIGPALNQPPATNEGCEAGILPPLRATVPIPPSCTLFGANLQVPRGNWTVTAVNVRTGARTGPMRVQIVQALRSQAQAPGNPGASGAICCTSPAQSQVFTLPPNSITTVPVNVPVRNTREIIDGEPIEVVDYIGLSLLDLSSSLPAAADPSSVASLFYPALNQGGQQLLGPSLPGALPLVSAVVCPAAGAASLQERRSMQIGGCPVIPGSTPVGPAPGPGGAAQPAIPSSLRQVGVAGNPSRVAIPVACGVGTGTCTGTLRATTVRRLPRPLTTRPAAFRIGAGRVGAATLLLPARARVELARRGSLALNLVLNAPGTTPSRSRVVVRLLPRTARTTGAGAVRVLVDMPPEAVASTRARLQLRRGRVVAGAAIVPTRPGRVVAATLRLSAAERARVRRAGRARLALRAVYRDAAGGVLVRSRPITVIAPRR